MAKPEPTFWRSESIFSFFFFFVFSFWFVHFKRVIEEDEEKEGEEEVKEKERSIYKRQIFFFLLSWWAHSFRGWWLLRNQARLVCSFWRTPAEGSFFFFFCLLLCFAGSKWLWCSQSLVTNHSVLSSSHQHAEVFRQTCEYRNPVEPAKHTSITHGRESFEMRMHFWLRCEGASGLFEMHESEIKKKTPTFPHGIQCSLFFEFFFFFFLKIAFLFTQNKPNSDSLFFAQIPSSATININKSSSLWYTKQLVSLNPSASRVASHKRSMQTKLKKHTLQWPFRPNQSDAVLQLFPKSCSRLHSRSRTTTSPATIPDSNGSILCPPPTSLITLDHLTLLENQTLRANKLVRLGSFQRHDHNFKKRRVESGKMISSEFLVILVAKWKLMGCVAVAQIGSSSIQLNCRPIILPVHSVSIIKTFP